MEKKRTRKWWLIRSSNKQSSQMLENKERGVSELTIPGHCYPHPSVYPLSNCHRFKSSNWSQGGKRRFFFFFQQFLTNLVFSSPEDNDRGNLWATSRHPQPTRHDVPQGCRVVPMSDPIVMGVYL